MLRVSATIGVEQNSPISTPGVAKRASADATARSQVATSWQPAAVAIPDTQAITGCGSATICLHHVAADRHDVPKIGLAAIGIGAPRRQLLQIVARR